MKIGLIFTLFLTFMGAAQAELECTVKTNEYCVILDWVDGPYLGKYSEARVEFYDKRQVLITPTEEVKVYPWMIMHGHAHGSRPVESSFLSEGVLEVSKIFFMQGMKGTWQLKLDIDNKSYILYAVEV